MTRKILAVALCCSAPSVSARCSSGYAAPDGPPLAVLLRWTPHSRQKLACEGLSYWHPGHVMPEPPSGRGVGRSEPWAETNRPRLAWSRTRSDGSPVQLAGCRRSWLRHRASAVAGGQSGRCPYSRPEEPSGVDFPELSLPPLC